MTDTLTEARAAVEPLLGAEDDLLLAELGTRALAAGKDPAVAGSFSPDVAYDGAEMGALEDVRKFGQRLFNRWNRELHGLLCGSDPDDAADREQLANALGMGEAAVAALLATMMVSSLGLAPAVAAVAAALVVKRFFKPALQEFCATWTKALA